MTRQENKTDKPVQRRKSGSHRRLEIARAAARLFAADGFSVTTRKISESLGITQAALYKHYASKDEIIEEVFRVRYLEEKPSDFSQILESSGEPAIPLVERLALAYESFFGAMTETSMKLFLRASQDGLEIAKRYSPHLDERILWPVLENVRVFADLPTLAELPATRDERELALMLHSTIVFLGIRKFVYQIDFKGTEAHLIREYVTVWLAGAIVSIRRYHDLT